MQLPRHKYNTVTAWSTQALEPIYSQQMAFAKLMNSAFHKMFPVPGPCIDKHQQTTNNAMHPLVLPLLGKMPFKVMVGEVGPGRGGGWGGVSGQQGEVGISWRGSTGTRDERPPYRHLEP